MTKLIYDGPHLEVEVPHDNVPGGAIFAERGKVVDVPDDIAKGLLEQGDENIVGADGKTTVVSHQGPWRKASDKQINAEKNEKKGGEAA